MQLNTPPPRKGYRGERGEGKRGGGSASDSLLAKAEVLSAPCEPPPQAHPCRPSLRVCDENLKQASAHTPDGARVLFCRSQAPAGGGGGGGESMGLPGPDRQQRMETQTTRALTIHIQLIERIRTCLPMSHTGGVRKPLDVVPDERIQA